MTSPRRSLTRDRPLQRARRSIAPSDDDNNDDATSNNDDENGCRNARNKTYPLIDGS